MGSVIESRSLSETGSGADVGNTDRELVTLAALFRQSEERLAQEFSVMCTYLAKIKTIAAENFYVFVANHLQLSRRTADRYLKIYDGLKLVGNGRIDRDAHEKFTRSALYLLAQENDGELVNEIQQLAAKGEKISEATVKTLIERRNDAMDAELAAARAQASDSQRKLEQLREKAERDEKLYRLDVIQLNELAMRRETEKNDMAAEVERLRNMTTMVEEVEVQVLPEGYMSAQAAVTAKERELREAESRLDQRKNELAEKEERLAKLNARVARAESNRALADKFVVGLSKLLSEIPPEALRQALDETPSLKIEVVNVVRVLAAAVAVG